MYIPYIKYMHTSLIMCICVLNNVYWKCYGGSCFNKPL